MENQKENKFMSIAYQLYVEGDKGLEMMEEATAEKPFQFITGFGIALDAFEQQVVGLNQGDTFEFAIPKEQAYGEYMDEHVLDLDREMFCINGHFDHEHIYEGAIIPLQNEEGRHFYGHVLTVGEEKVKVDLNHPLAGETLHFKGSVLETREATNKEIEHMVAHMTGGCGCGCDDCGGCEDHCGHEGHEHCGHEGHEHCGHEDHDHCGCGHCH